MDSRVVVRNLIALFSGNAIINLLSFFTMVFLARTLGDVGIGQYSFIFALGFLFFIIGNPGLDYLILKDVSANKELLPKYGANGLAIKIVLAGIAIVFSFLLSFLIERSPTVIYSLRVVGLIIGSQIIGSFFVKVLQVNERMDLTTKASVVERMIACSLGIAVLYLTRSLLYFTLVLLVSEILKECLLIRFSRQYFQPRVEIDLKMWKELLLKSLPFSLSTFFIIIYAKTDTIMLSLLKNDQVTGWYNAAYRLIDVVNYVPFLIVTAILPVMARYVVEDRKKLNELLMQSLRYLIILAIPLGVGVVMLSPELIYLIYGDGFQPANDVLRILICTEVIVFMTTLIAQMLNISNRQTSFMTIIGLTAGLNVLLNLILIPRFSHLGAAAATLFCELVVFLMLAYVIKNTGIVLSMLSLVWRPLIASSIMAIVILAIHSLPLLVIIPVSMICYFTLFFLLKGFTRKDLAGLQTIISIIRSDQNGSGNAQ
jgi:O-antigen/teichoic acid export membrane protein